MASSILQGIFQGLGEGYQKHQESILSRELERRKGMSSFYEKMAEHPSMSPEGAMEMLKRSLTIKQIPYDKKLPKELEPPEDLVKGFNVERTPAYSNEPSRSSAFKLPVGESGMGSAEIPEMSVAPPVPPRASLPALYSNEERQTMSENLLRSQEDIKTQAALREAQGKRDIDIRTPAPRPPSFTSRNPEYDVINEQTGEIVHRGTGETPTPPNLTDPHIEWALVEGFKEPQQVFTIKDTAAPDYGRSYINTSSGRVDVTGKTTRAPSSEPSMVGDLNPRQASIMMSMMNSLKGHPAYVDMLDIDTGLQTVEVGLRQKNGFGDITAINAFQRMVDPGATVRSEDVTLLQSARGLVDTIISTYPIERLRTGAQLPEPVRARMMQTAKDLYEKRATNYNDIIGNQYRASAKAVGIPFEYIGRDFQVGGAPKPPVGSELDKGGTREIVTYKGKQYYLVGQDNKGNAILEPVPAPAARK